MQIAKKTVLTNTARTTLGISARTVEDALLELHKNDNDNFAIGDIKNTTRVINDANWHKCDGSYLLTNVSTDIKNTLTRQNQIKLSTGIMQDTNGTNWTYYSDSSYVIIGSSYSITNAGGWAKLFVYTRNEAGDIVANSQKTLRSWGDKYSMAWPGPIIKCGSYYYTVVKYDDEDSEGLDTRYWHLYYTTNPTGTWSSRQIWSGGDSNRYLNGLYTNGSTVRLEISSYNNASASNPKAVTVYTFSGDTSNITSSSYNITISINDVTHNDEYNIYPMGDGKYFRLVSSFGRLTYKSSFTATSWTQVDPPSWANAIWGVYYMNGKYYAIFEKDNGSNPYTFVFAWASSLNTLLTSTEANLSHIEWVSYAQPARCYGFANSVIWSIAEDRTTVESTTTYKVYLIALTENGIKKLLVDDTHTWRNNYTYLITNSSNYTAVLHNTSSDLRNSFYFIGLSYPDMTNEPYDAYMKIATN